jgi:hypothetical protein
MKMFFDYGFVVNGRMEIGPICGGIGASQEGSRSACA